MNTDTSRVDSSEPRASRAKMNTLSIVSIVLVAAATIGVATQTWSWGVIFAGFEALAFPAVGAGHVALRQIKVRRERGAILAYIALAVCYLYAASVLVSSVYVGILHMHQVRH